MKCRSLGLSVPSAFFPGVEAAQNSMREEIAFNVGLELLGALRDVVVGKIGGAFAKGGIVEVG